MRGEIARRYFLDTAGAPKRMHSRINAALLGTTVCFISSDTIAHKASSIYMARLVDPSRDAFLVDGLLFDGFIIHRLCFALVCL